MQVTPVKKKFFKHEVGSNFELPDKTARTLIAAGLLRASDPGEEISPRTGRAKRTYRRRDMVAQD